MELQTVYQLKAAGFSRWAGDGSQSECPHDKCTRGEPTALSHWFWDCDSAQRVWSHFLAPWMRLFGEHWQRLQRHVFQFHISRVPALAVDLLIRKPLPKADKDAQLDVLLRVLQHSWTGMVISVLHCLWIWRVGLLYGEELQPQQHWVKLVAHTKARIKAVGRTFEHDRNPRLAATVRILFQVMASLGSNARLPRMVTPTSGTTHYVCFFDGGSRGNPDPGGSGSVIVRVDMSTRAAGIHWCACMAYGARTTTNNVAEYWGLVYGLRYARSTHLRPLHIVGDSALILSQVERHRPPKAQHLRPLYQQAQRLASELAVVSWSHHLRAFNKVADAAANVAMENRSSFNVAQRSSVPKWHTFNNI